MILNPPTRDPTSVSLVFIVLLDDRGKILPAAQQRFRRRSAEL